MSALLDTVLEAASSRLHVFPVEPPIAGDEKSGKRPLGALVPQGKSNATNDETIIRWWWSQHPDANYGISCAPSGLVVLDVDPRHGGNESLAQIAAQLPPTFTVRTGSGGQHLYFSAPPGELIQRIGVMPGIDLIGNGYVVGPGSAHFTGGRYEIVHSVPFAPLPQLLVEMRRTAATSGDRKAPEKIPSGQRNDTLFRLGCSLRHKGLSENEIASTLLAVNAGRCDPPLDEGEIRTIAAQAGVYEAVDVGTRAQAATVNIFGEPAAPVAQPTPASGEYGRDLCEYLGADDPGDSPDEWLVEGLIAAGVPQVLAGHPKSYKTFLLEYLMICAALGVDAFGRFKVRRTRGLILPREDAERETRRRVWRLVRGIAHQRGEPVDLRELAGWLTIETVKPFYWTDPASMDDLKRTIERRQLGFVAVDSLARTNPGDENSTKDMSLVCNAWADVALQFGCAVPMIHHFTKSGTGTLLQQLRGSGVIGATMRHAIGVEKAETRGDPFELSFEGNLHPLPAPFSIQMLDGMNSAGQRIITFEYKGAGRAQPVGTINLDSSPNIEAISLVIRAMRDCELTGQRDSRGESLKLSTADIRKRARLSMTACETALEEALERGLVTRGRRGQRVEGWLLTEPGRAFDAGRT